jgi:hypothetical protein
MNTDFVKQNFKEREEIFRASKYLPENVYYFLL